MWEAGAYGVDLFFVISGFVIVWVAAHRPAGRASATEFLVARVARIYPTWWLFLGLMMIALLLIRGTPWDPLRLEEIGLEGPEHLLRSILLLPQPHHPTLGVGWTLVHEMYFYLGFSALIWALPPHRRLIGLFVWGGFVILGAPLGFSSTFGRNFIELLFFPLTLQFILGGVVAYGIQAGIRRFAPVAVILGSLGVLIFFLGHGTPWMQNVQAYLPAPWRRTILMGLPAALLVYGLVALELQGKLKALFPPALVVLGNWSYALYLCHTLTIQVAGRAVYKLFGSEAWWSNLLYCLSATIATVMCAAVTYRYFERPLIRRFKERRPRLETTRAPISSDLA